MSPAHNDEYRLEDEVQDRILRSLRRILRAVELHSKRLKLSCGLTTPQLLCLNAIMRSEAATVTGIALDISVSKSTMVRILDRLESRGLVSRQREEVDRRVVRVTLTVSGHEALAAAPSALQDRLLASLKKLGELERVAIAMSLERVVELMEADSLNADPVLQTGPLDASVLPGNDSLSRLAGETVQN